jgi:hypothetical protein
VPADAVVMAFGFRPHSMEWLAKHSVELDSQGRIIPSAIAVTTRSEPRTISPPAKIFGLLVWKAFSLPFPALSTWCRQTPSSWRLASVPTAWSGWRSTASSWRGDHQVGTAHDIATGEDFRVAGLEGVLAAFRGNDDIVRGSDLVVTAIAEGRKAADGILNYLEV